MKVKLFTHTDLDGISCGLIGKLAFDQDIDITYCDYDNVDDAIQDFILMNGGKDFDKVFITDISVNETTAEMIEALKNPGPFKLLDHHSSADWLNKYDWATVKEYYEDGSQTSGTSMFYDYIKENPNALDVINKKSISHYIELVRRYDTWEWSTVFQDYDAKALNDLFYILGKDRFLDNMYARLLSHEFFNFSKTEQLLLELEENKIQTYINKIEKNIRYVRVGEYVGCFVIADKYLSELGNELNKRHPNYDFVAILNFRSTKVSYRTIHDHVDVSKIAAKFGGGGRAKTAGSELVSSFYDDICSLFIEKHER